MIHTLLDVAMLKTSNAPLADGRVLVGFDSVDGEEFHTPTDFWASPTRAAVWDSYMSAVSVGFDNLTLGAVSSTAAQNKVVGSGVLFDAYLASAAADFDLLTGGDYTPSALGGGFGVATSFSAYLATSAAEYDNLTEGAYTPAPLGSGFGQAVTTSY